MKRLWLKLGIERRLYFPWPNTIDVFITFSDMHDNKHSALYMLITSVARFGLMPFSTVRADGETKEVSGCNLILFEGLYLGFYMKYTQSGLCTVTLEDDWMLLSRKSLWASSPGSGKPSACTASGGSALARDRLTEMRASLLFVRPCDSLNRCVRKLTFPSSPALPARLKRISRTPHPWTWSSLSWVRVTPPIFVEGPVRVYFISCSINRH